MYRVARLGGEGVIVAGVLIDCVNSLANDK